VARRSGSSESSRSQARGGFRHLERVPRNGPMCPSRRCMILPAASGFQDGPLNSPSPHNLAREATEFREQAFEPLAYSIRRGSVEIREFFPVGSVQLQINQQI
jgi:hypothetical protein